MRSWFRLGSPCWQGVRDRCQTCQDRSQDEADTDAEHRDHPEDSEDDRCPDGAEPADSWARRQSRCQGGECANQHDHDPREDVPEWVVAFLPDNDHVDDRRQPGDNGAGRCRHALGTAKSLHPIDATPFQRLRPAFASHLLSSAWSRFTMRGRVGRFEPPRTRRR